MKKHDYLDRLSVEEVCCVIYFDFHTDVTHYVMYL